MARNNSNTTQIVTREEAQLGFTGSVTSLVDAVNRMAVANIQVVLQQNSDQQFGALQIKAMQKIEALRLVGALDLAGIMARWEIIKEIRDENLLATHPSNFATLEAMAEQQGISVSELHDIENLGGVIFPWLIENVGPNAIADTWDELGKSRMREMVSVLTSSISGTVSSSRRVRDAIANAEVSAAQVFNQEAQEAGIDATWDQLPQEDRVRRRTNELMETARNTQNVRELRQALRGPGTANVQFLKYTNGVNVVITANVSPDQLVMINRLLNGHVTTVDLSLTDPNNEEVRRAFMPVISMLERAEDTTEEVDDL